MFLLWLAGDGVIKMREVARFVSRCCTVGRSETEKCSREDRQIDKDINSICFKCLKILRVFGRERTGEPSLSTNHHSDEQSHSARNILIRVFS